MLNHDVREAVARPFGRSLHEAITWTLIDADDLMTALEHADVHVALYVGRRVDQGWRRVEHLAANWLGDDYQHADPQFHENDVRRAVDGVRALPAIPVAEASAAEWSACARDALKVAGDAVFGLAPDVHDVAVGMRVAREAFSLYRLAKYRWVALALKPAELARVAYQVLEA